MNNSNLDLNNIINNRNICNLSDIKEHAIWNFKNNLENNSNLNTPNKISHAPNSCTWLYFTRKILPNAIKIQAKLDDITKLMAITNNNSNLLKWNNPFSWYYHNGINLEIRKRIQLFGGKADYTQIRCSIIYDTDDEIDLHCITPNDNHLFYCRKNIDCGVLDVDSEPQHKTPVKSIYFNNHAPEGVYQFYIQSYKQKPNSTPLVTIELEVNNKIYTTKEVLVFENQKKVIFEFDYSKNKNNNNSKNIRFLSEVVNTNPNLSPDELKNIWNLDIYSSSSSSNNNNNNNNNNAFINITSILNSPNIWNNNLNQESLQNQPKSLNNNTNIYNINKKNHTLKTTQYYQLKDTSYFSDYKKYFANSMEYNTNYIYYSNLNQEQASIQANNFNQHHVFFLLENCVDLSQIKGKTLPLEHINNNLNLDISAFDNSTLNNNFNNLNLNNFACGIGYIKEEIWNLNLKVTDNSNLTKLYNITKFF